MTSRLSAAKEAIANKNRGGGNDGKGKGKRKRGSGNDNDEKDDPNDHDGERGSNKRWKPCDLHKNRHGKCNHEFKTCSANPDRDNANYSESSCKKVLG